MDACVLLGEIRGVASRELDGYVGSLLATKDGHFILITVALQPRPAEQDGPFVKRSDYRTLIPCFPITQNKLRQDVLWQMSCST